MIKIYFCERVPDPDKKADGISQHRLAYRLLEQSIRENWPETEKEPFHYTAAPGGKPRLEGHPEIHFNISHCAACAACALGDAPVGIDVENRFPWKESLAARICHPLERERLRKLEPEEQEQWLNRIWSRKEKLPEISGNWHPAGPAGISGLGRGGGAGERLPKTQDRRRNLLFPGDSELPVYPDSLRPGGPCFKNRYEKRCSLPRSAKLQGQPFFRMVIVFLFGLCYSIVTFHLRKILPRIP